MLLKQDSEKRELLTIKRDNLKKKLSSLRDNKEKLREPLRLQLDLAMKMKTLRKQRPILQNGRKEKLLKTGRLKKKSQNLKKSLKKSNKKLMKHSRRDNRRSVKIKLKNSNLWRNYTLLKNQKLENLKFRFNSKKISFVNNKEHGKFAESKRLKRIKSKTLNLRL